MSSPETPAERAYVAVRLAQMDQQLDQARAAMEASFDAYRDDWSTRHAEQLRAHNERIRQIEADQAEWLRNFYTDDSADEGAHLDVGRDQVGASAAVSSPASPPGPGPGQPNHAAELAEAERIRALPISTWAEERQSMIRANRGLFSQETR